MNYKNIITIGVNAYHTKLLEEACKHKKVNFVNFGDLARVLDPYGMDAREFIGEAASFIRNSGQEFSGILVLNDFPPSIVARAIGEIFGFSGPSLKSVFLNENKVWSRVIQQRVCPEITPDFWFVDLSEPAFSSIRFPAFVKPVKASTSNFSQRVDSVSELNAVAAALKDTLPAYTKVFNDLINPSDGPVGYRHVNGSFLIVEEIIKGTQFTFDGMVMDGKVYPLGIVDSHLLPDGVSFERFQYPSGIPVGIQEKVASVSARLINASGLDDTLFNIEFFYDGAADELSILEINTRTSPKAADLYLKVDGFSPYETMVDLALGERAVITRGKGAYKVAACFLLQTTDNCILGRVPTEAEINTLKKAYPDLRVSVPGKRGDDLSASFNGKTYRYAFFSIGANNETELLRKAAEIKSRLPIELTF